MTQGAYVEIYGYLAEDIQFQEIDGHQKYGIIIIELEQRHRDYSHTSDNKHVRIPVIISNQELLENCSSLLKQNVKIWLVGELDIFNHKQLAMKVGGNTTNILQQSNIVINIKHKSGISFLKLPAGSEVRKAECKYFDTTL